MNLETDAEGTALNESAVRMLQNMGLNAEGRLTHDVTGLVPRLISAAEEYKAVLLVLSPVTSGRLPPR
ncbi:hypothetical protein [Streptomyces sp. WSLK1-3]|uniref:hypothetical protein n=1 Tax=Streptomyces sp. WSLK1-3 TaxID=3375475 RepID=UPI0037D9C5A4